MTVCVGGAPIVIDCSTFDPSYLAGTCDVVTLADRGELPFAYCY
jgi:hypothetical protein